jgi:uncharacterized protein (TIGR03086 family)
VIAQVTWRVSCDCPRTLQLGGWESHLLWETVGVSGDRTLASQQALDDLRAAIAVAEAIVAGISAGQWGAPTPCTDVDVRALVNHLVTGNLHFASLIFGLPVPDGDEDHLGTEPAEAFRAAAASLTTALGAPGVLDRTYRLPAGEVPGLGLIEIRLIEHLGHGWDLAKATEQPVPFPDDVAERGLAIAKRQLENRRAGGLAAFGAEVEVPEDAPAIDRLAGFLGRGA